MANRFLEIGFTDAVRKVQENMDSRKIYAKREAGPTTNDRLGDKEAAFIAARDSFYMATVSESGWPYVQHRGGPVGFVRVLGETSIGFADFAGNRQYISTGNLTANDRVALFFMDYANKLRLKAYGHAEIISRDDTITLERLTVADYRARIERGIVIHIEALDWNCPQHITPRLTLEEFDTIAGMLEADGVS